MIKKVFSGLLYVYRPRGRHFSSQIFFDKVINAVCDSVCVAVFIDSETFFSFS